MKKKILTLMLALCVMTGNVLSTAGALTVQAEGTEGTAKGEASYREYKYKILDDGTVEITSYQETEGVTELVIPETINGKKVTSIGQEAFDTGGSLTSIKLPSGLKTIGDSAFSSCKKISSIVIPNGVTTIGKHAFFGCTNLSSITVPDSVTSIGSYAFVDTKWLENERKKNPLVIVSGILIDGTTASGNVRIPEGVTSIADVAFRWTSTISSVTIPNGVTSIGELAFYNCKSMSSVTMPDTVTSIGERAFDNCCNLSSIEIPKGLKRIEYQTFVFCSGLSSIVIPDGVTVIEEQAFMGCESLRSITIPRSVTSIGDDLFYGCIELTDIYYMGSEAEWKAIPAFHDEYSTSYNTTIHYASNKSVALRTLNLSKTTVTYTGKAQKPTVKVKDEKGKTVNSAHYTVAYSNNKNVGQATVTVTGKDGYTGRLKATFTIRPKGTTLSNVTAKKKAFAVKWKKQTKQTTGYQIQYSTSKKFKSAKTVPVKKNKTTSTTVKKLKAKKNYYVRIRTYKTVKIGGKSKNIYSAWSKAKTVKTKAY